MSRRRRFVLSERFAPRRVVETSMSPLSGAKQRDLIVDAAKRGVEFAHTALKGGDLPPQ